jgi:hypothetical protein
MRMHHHIRRGYTGNLPRSSTNSHTAASVVVVIPKLLNSCWHIPEEGEPVIYQAAVAVEILTQQNIQFTCFCYFKVFVGGRNNQHEPEEDGHK